MILLKIGLWILNLMCLGGQVLVAKKNKIGALLWIIADALYAVYDFNVHQTEQACLWTAYTFISIWQYNLWRKNEKK